MRYTFLISPRTRPAFLQTSEDRTLPEALLTLQMLRDCYPDAKVSIHRTF